MEMEIEIKNQPKYKYPKGYRAYLIIEKKINKKERKVFSVSVDGENQGQLWREIDRCISEMFKVLTH